jgi:Fe(3+) dicitrate transport protein
MPRRRLFVDSIAAVVMLLVPSAVFAQAAEESEADDPYPEDPIDVNVFDNAREVERVAGSAHRKDEEELERDEDDDPHRVLRFPGVYVRGEDGYGLRPNIGMRGAISDRSKKVTLMEDGVLLGPAPYSAPAAYYFPIMTRMTAVEVFKGPSAIRYGPQTIGGAINFVTRRIPWGHTFGADIAAGSELYGKGHGYYGYGTDHWGVLVEGVRLRSNGFKDLDAPASLGDPPNTGFDKIELMAKGRVNTNPAGRVYHEGLLKLGYGREVSNETYLGLSDADFEEAPLRRYAASQLDRMKWDRTLVELSHAMIVRRKLALRTTLYRHDFHRAWFKLNRFAGEAEGGPALSDILADPSSGQRAVYYDVLTGAQDSTAPGETLLVGTNDRTFVSQGIQTNGAWTVPKLGPVAQTIRFGIRLHHDSIERLHTEDGFLMRSSRLVSNGAPRAITTENSASTVAGAGYLADEVAIWRFLVAPGVRFEHILTDFEDHASGEVVAGNQQALLPGIGVLYQVVGDPRKPESIRLALLSGVHQGFSPVAPGQSSDVLPEVALNYEGGARFGGAEYVEAEAIAFFSDYSNITGQCTFSSGCSEDLLDDQFNGGEAHVYGVEASAGTDIPTPVDIHLPIKVSYTFTGSSFRQSFTSADPLFGEVTEGDDVPYIPPHQVAASAAMVSERWGHVSLGFTFVDAMREKAGQGEPLPGEVTDAYAVVDAGAQFNVLPELGVYAKCDNLLDNRYVASRLPFGARPGRPRFFYVGVKVEIDRK